MTVDHHDLVDRARAGDRGAANTLLAAISPLVARQLARYPVSEEDRRDLLQSALVQVARRLGSFRGDASFTTWLFRVTANEALMLMRSQRRFRARVQEGFALEDLSALAGAAEGSLELTLIARDATAALREALETLPADYREVLEAHYAEDLGLDEIAARLGVSESAVRSRLHRARQRLREGLPARALAA